MPTIVLHKPTDRHISRSPSARIAFLAIGFILLLFLSVGCSQGGLPALTAEDRAAIAATATEYYEKIEDGNYAYAIDFLSVPDDALSIQTKLVTLKELFDQLGYRIEWDESFSAGDVSFHAEKGMPFVYTVATVRYDNVPGGTINEVLYFEKHNERWHIAHIDSPDRYIPYRAPAYTVTSIPDFLLPAAE